MKRLKLKSIFHGSCICMMLMGLAACSSDTDGLVTSPDTDMEQTTEKASDYHAIELTRSMRECNAAMNHAAMNLFFEALENEKNKGNVLLSPLSVNYVLAALVNGAQGQTREEIIQYFGIENLEVANQLFKLYTSELTSLDNQVKLNLGNSLWIDQEYFVNPDYVNTLNDGWPVAIYSERLNTSECMNHVNTWVEENTSGLIKEFLKKPLQGPMGVFNTVYFNGKWQKPFKASATVSAKFDGINGSTDVEMMQGEREVLKYAKGENWQGVALPYGNGNFEMRLILPDEGLSLSEVSSFEDDSLWEAGYRVKTSVPKFECRYRKNDFESVLKGLGINKIFSTDNDELSKILVGVNKGLAIGEFIHEAVVKVDESGAEMAAASGAVIIGSDGEFTNPVDVDMVFDRPFIFEIRETSTNTLIFIGAINNL